MTSEENKLYNAAVIRFLNALEELVDSEEAIGDAVCQRAAVTDQNESAGQHLTVIDELLKSDYKVTQGTPGKSDEKYVIDGRYTIDIGRTNETINAYFGEDFTASLKLREKLIIDAMIAHGLKTPKSDENYLAYAMSHPNDLQKISNRFDDIPRVIVQAIGKENFKPVPPDSCRFSENLLSRLTNTNSTLLDALISEINNKDDFKDALNTLSELLRNTTNNESGIKTVTQATVTLLNEFNALGDAPNKEDVKQIFDTYEEACKTSNAPQFILKAAAIVIITGVFAALGACVGGVLLGAAGIAAGAWSGPGAAVSGILGAFGGSVTGWAIGTMAAAAVTGALFGGVAGAAATFGLFKQKPLDNSLVNQIGKVKDAALNLGSESGADSDNPQEVSNKPG
jgi:hypothetical protein